jgi:hypothetical protein
MNNTLLKDIDLNIYPECPDEYLHQSGTMGIICDRAGLKYIVTPPLIKACEYLYDLNIRTISAGANTINELGVWIEYNSLSDENKKIVDALKEKGLVILAEETDKGRLTAGDIRISLNVDFDKETVQSASEKVMRLVKSFEFQLQDVMFGFTPISVAVEERIERTSERTMKWNGQEFVTIEKPTETKEESLEKLLEKGCVIDGDNLWISTELYNKHLDYLGSLHKVENTILQQ